MAKEKFPEVNEVKLSSGSLQWLLGGLATMTLTMVMVGFAYTREIEHRITLNEAHYQELAKGQVANSKKSTENQAAILKVLNKLANNH